MDLNEIENIGNSVKYNRESVESRRVPPSSIPAYGNAKELREAQVRQFDDMVYGDVVEESQSYDPKQEMKRMTSQLSASAITSSGLPESIKQSIMSNPLVMSPIEDPKMTELEEKLQRSMPGIQKSMKILTDLDKYDEKQKEKINENTIQRTPKASSSVDYDLIRQIVESVVDEKLNGITSVLNESVSHGSPSLSIMSIKNSKFLFLDDNNNIFECQMVYKGKNKAKRK